MFDSKLMFTHRVVCNLEGYYSPRRLRAHKSRSLCLFSIKQDESTDILSCSQLKTFVRYRKVKSKRNFCSARN